jgi:hypothetical protein
LCLFFTFNQVKLIVQEWEGRLNVRMSNSVMAAIRESVREMAIGRTKTTDKADRATVEQVKHCNLLLAFFNYQKMETFT